MEVECKGKNQMKAQNRLLSNGVYTYDFLCHKAVTKST